MFKPEGKCLLSPSKQLNMKDKKIEEIVVYDYQQCFFKIITCKEPILRVKFTRTGEEIKKYQIHSARLVDILEGVTDLPDNCEYVLFTFNDLIYYKIYKVNRSVYLPVELFLCATVYMTIGLLLYDKFNNPINFERISLIGGIFINNKDRKPLYDSHIKESFKAGSKTVDIYYWRGLCSINNNNLPIVIYNERNYMYLLFDNFKKKEYDLKEYNVLKIIKEYL